MVTGDSISFDAYVTDMGQSFSSTWNTVDVYGRNDPIATFQGTKRTISLGFEVPAANKEEAETNLEKCAKLATFLYPGYKIDGEVKKVTGKKKFIETGKAVSRAPLIKLKLANLIDTMSGSKPKTKKEKKETKKKEPPTQPSPTSSLFEQEAEPAKGKGKESKSKKKQKIEGLLGFIDSYNFTPSIDAGMFRGGANLFPRNITVTISFTVLHQVELGHAAKNISVDKKGEPQYGANAWMGGKLPFT